MIMTPLVRHAARAAPLFAISAPDQGSGKTLLGHLPAYVATGRSPTIIAHTGDAAEERKRMLTLLLDGSAVTLLDNVSEPLASDLLCKVLTSASHADRLLGVNQKAVVSTATTWIATGNNMTVNGDLSSRTLRCEIDPGCERPDQRRFDVDLHELVPSRRGELASAALTIVRAYLAAGAPATIPVYGRFESWSDLVRGPLVWLGLADPCISRAVVERKDAVRQMLGDLLEAWHGVFGDSRQTVSTAIEVTRPGQLPDGREVPQTESTHALRNALAAVSRADRAPARRQVPSHP
jgi:hypothetical protein